MYYLNREANMSKLKKIPIILSIILLSMILLNSMLFTMVPIDKIGVKINKWGGLVKEDYKVGLHFSIVGIYEWKFLDATTQFIDFNKDVKGTEPLIIRTEDNNEVYIDVTVPYKIIKNEAYQLVKGGLEKTYKDRVELIVKSVLRSELANLSLTGQNKKNKDGSNDVNVDNSIINTDYREKIAAEALIKLNEKLKKVHVRADYILIRSFYFINKKVERTIQEKQYLRQEKLLKEAQLRENDAKLATSKIETEIVNAEKAEIENANKGIEELKATYEIKIAEIEREKNNYDKRVRAEGDAKRAISESKGRLEMAKADALKIQLEAKLLKSRGGKIFIAKQVAENIDIGEIWLNSNINRPLDTISLESLLRLVTPK
jgi:hypothetical protein